MKTKTAQIYRHAVYGTSRHCQMLRYKGFSYLCLDCAGHETIRLMFERALILGFTHIRFTGDWSRYTVRKTMKIKPGGYTFEAPTIADTLRSSE